MQDDGNASNDLPYKNEFKTEYFESAEMATALVTGILAMMFSWTMLHYVGGDGVAAVTGNRIYTLELS